MAAFSLIFAAGKRRPKAAPLTAGENAPSISLSLAFISAGLLSLFGTVGWLVAQPALLAEYHYNQHIVAATHLLVLGWICTVVMGALYQLVPVALETRLHSERIAFFQLAFHTAGFLGMVWMFRRWNLEQVGHFAVILTAGFGLFVYNMARTLGRAPRWNVTAAAVAAMLVWLLLTAAAGVSMAAAKSLGDLEGASPGPLIRGFRSLAAVVTRCDAIGAMHAHAHAGVIGCFVMLLVGVSYKLIPMFTLSEVQSSARARWSIILLNLSLAGTFVAVAVRSPWKLVFAVGAVVAVALYLWELLAMVRARQRPTLDWGLRYFLTAVGFLAPLGGLALVLSWPGLPRTPLTGQLENVYGFLGLIGVVTFAIIGMLYKIVPFLVWYGRYSRLVGRAQVPALADLYSARWQAFGYWFYVAGLAVASAGIVLASQWGVRAGGLLLALAAATLARNVVSMLSHFFRPRLTPLPAVAVTTPSS